MSERIPGFDEATDTRGTTKLQEPKMYKVLMHNDDYTTMEFVIDTLETLFHKNAAQAAQIMLAVHEKGLGLCGVYTHEVAETKIAIVHERAQQNEFPLQCSMEEE